eukprot:jgi/Tetstr1/455495/TSEL_042324.t1
MADAGKAVAVEGVRTTATAHVSIEAVMRSQISTFFATQETPMPPAAAGEDYAIPGGDESCAGGLDHNVRAPFAPSSEPHYLDWKTALATALLGGNESGMTPDSMRRPGLFPITLDRVLDEYLLGVSRLQPAADEYYHAA